MIFETLSLARLPPLATCGRGRRLVVILIWDPGQLPVSFHQKYGQHLAASANVKMNESPLIHMLQTGLSKLVQFHDGIIVQLH